MPVCLFSMTDRAGTPVNPLPPEAADALLDRVEARVLTGKLSCSREEAVALEAIAIGSRHGHGAFEVALGEGLDLILRRGGLARLAASRLRDLVRERLGLEERYACRLRRNAVKLRERPHLRAAVVAGDVSSRKAEVLLERSDPAEDAHWTARARTDTVRTLMAALRRKRGAAAEEAVEEEEDWRRLEVDLPPTYKELVRTALDHARILEGGTASRLTQVEVMLMEFLGEFALPVGERVARAADVGRSAANDPMAATDAGPAPQPVSAATSPPADEGPFDPEAELAALQALVQGRAGLNERYRRATLLVQETRAHGWLGFARFGPWCTERLGVSPRTVRSHLALERELRDLPALRQAVRARVLDLERAREVARLATPEDVEERIAAAAAKPVISTRREADEQEDRQMWDASKLTVSLPERVNRLWRDAVHAGRHYFPKLTPGELWVVIAAHCLETWRPEVEHLLKKTDKAIIRDGWRCQVPGCSGAAAHLHHIRYRSHGGSNERWNLVSLCVAHHLAGVHQGYIEISGHAPDGLVFLLGEVEVRRARQERRLARPAA